MSRPATAAPEALLERDRALEADGRSTMLVQRGGHFLGVVGLVDMPREAAKEGAGRSCSSLL